MEIKRALSEEKITQTIVDASADCFQHIRKFKSVKAAPDVGEMIVRDGLANLGPYLFMLFAQLNKQQHMHFGTACILVSNIALSLADEVGQPVIMKPTNQSN